MALRSKSDCIFCQIVSGQAPSCKVYEDELSLAFMDIFPAVEGHTLVITKDHCENLYDSQPESLAAAAVTWRRVAQAIRDELQPEGMSVYQANGAAAGQTVFHYHTHLLPRSEGSPLTLHGRGRADLDQLQDLATRFAKRLESIPS